MLDVTTVEAYMLTSEKIRFPEDARLGCMVCPVIG